MATPPLFLTIWSVKARGGYAEVLVSRTPILLLLSDLAYRKRTEPWRLSVLGFVAGLAFWINQLVMPYLAIFSLSAVARLGPRAALLATEAMPRFLLGSIPFWVSNVRNGFASFGTLSRLGDAQGLTLVTLLRNVRDFGKLSAPVLLGFAEPQETLAMRQSLFRPTSGP